MREPKRKLYFILENHIIYYFLKLVNHDLFDTFLITASDDFKSLFKRLLWNEKTEQINVKVEY